MPWEVRMSNSRKLPYFFNKETNASSWEAPVDLTEEEINALPGADFLKTEGAKPIGGKPGQVRASHLLVKHKDSRRPSSWKEPKVMRTKEEATEILREHLEEINQSLNKHGKFAELAQVHSDCSSHSNGGDLGWFGRGDMQKAFEDAVYELEIGHVSGIVSTDSGVHILLRTG